MKEGMSSLSYSGFLSLKHAAQWADVPLEHSRDGLKEGDQCIRMDLENSSYWTQDIQKFLKKPEKRNLDPIILDVLKDLV